MEGAKFQATRGYRLDPAGHPQGVSCDEDGPSLGPIRLLTRTTAGFAPRPIDDLNFIISKTFGQAFDCTDLLPGLTVAAQALDEGDLMRAMIATQLLRLPVLSTTEANRASEAEAMLKIGVGNPKHPQWPKGSEGGVGGEFMPKTEEDNAKDAVKQRLRRRVTRRAFRAGLRRLLTWRRALRLSGEIASNAVPGLDAVGDAAMVADLVSMAGELEGMQVETDAALQFVEKGPQDLEDLRVTKEDISFPNYAAFTKKDLEKRFGSAGEGYEYHHIIEQNSNRTIPESILQSTRNIIRIPKLIHQEVTAEFSRVGGGGSSQSLRVELRGQSFDEQYKRGLEVLQKVGIIK